MKLKNDFSVVFTKRDVEILVPVFQSILLGYSGSKESDLNLIRFKSLFKREFSISLEPFEADRLEFLQKFLCGMYDMLEI